MRLFNKEIDKKLFKQYKYGADLSKQEVVAKIFNPYNSGRWYLVNSDESDPDYIWAVVQMGNVVEVGSVSRKQLESLRIKPFNLPLERDLSFGGVNASELFKGLSAGKFYKAGGWTEASENKDMLLNQAEGFEHHAEELESAVKKADYVPAWVVAKSQRASTDLSDITHYLDGENEQREEEMEGEEEYANGGEVKWQDAHYGDNALVVSENKMGIIIKPYGRKFHLRFADGTEKTYDATELKFFKDMDDFDMGGEVEGVDLFEDYENIPEKVQQILDNYADAFEDGDYKGLEKANKALLEIGYTFDYGLDGQAYDLRKVGEKGKSESYARGGKLDVGIYYKTKDGRQARYLGDTNDPEVGTFMNRADGVFKLRYDEIEGKASAFASGGMMAKGGKTEPDETVYIEYFNKAKKFAKDRKEFTGQNAYNEAVSWGRKNIGNFNLDMVKFKMADGGMTDPMATVNEISRLSGLRPVAVAEWGDKNNVNLSILLKDLKSKKIKGMDLMTAIVGNPNNKYQKELLAKYSRTKMAMGGNLKNYEIYHKTLSSALNEVDDWASKNGYTFTSDSYFPDVTIGGINYGETKRFSRDVKKEGKSKEGQIMIQVYRMDSGTYELNLYPSFKMGGKVKFADKVKSIKASLLERKKVSPKVQKDYGKTYSPKEAEESAKRIVGAMTAKERLMAKRKKGKK